MGWGRREVTYLLYWDSVEGRESGHVCAHQQGVRVASLLFWGALCLVFGWFGLLLLVLAKSGTLYLVNC